MTNTATIHVFLADDHPIVREGLQALFGEYPEFNVVGEAGDGLTAVTLFASLQPDVALIDLRMPGQDGIATQAGLPAVVQYDDDYQNTPSGWRIKARRIRMAIRPNPA